MYPLAIGDRVSCPDGVGRLESIDTGQELAQVRLLGCGLVSHPMQDITPVEWPTADIQDTIDQLRECSIFQLQGL